MISHKHKFISVHIMKCAATATQSALLPFCDLFTDDKHALLKEQMLEVKSNYFKFAFVRNPWDKVVSHYFFNHYLYFIRDMEFKKYVEALYEGKPITTAISATHLPWMLNQEGEFDIDFVGRFENLQEDFNFICSKVGLPEITLPVKNKTKHNHYSSYYDDESKEMVAEVFKEDINKFKFTFL